MAFYHQKKEKRKMKNLENMHDKIMECATLYNQQSLNPPFELRSHNHILTNRIFIASRRGANIDPWAGGRPSPSLYVFNISKGCERE